MQLLFITRKLDKKDTRTGFVFDWVNALAKQTSTLYVLCQEKGDTSGLAENIEVHSFGKEKGYGKIRQAYRLSLAAYRLSKNTSGIFCHMMPIYAIVAWLPAKLRGKKLALWYMHKSVDFKLRLAEKFVDIIFTASKESIRFPSKKLKIVGHGIPIEKFTSKESPIANRQSPKKLHLISIGRISRVKDYETLIKAIQILHMRYEISDIRLYIYGDPALPADFAYLQSLQEFVKNAELENIIDFKGGVPYSKVPEIISESDIFINLSKTGSLDKTVLEAGASKVLAMSSNDAFQRALSKISPLLFFERDDPEDLADKLIKLQKLSDQEKAKIRDEFFSWVNREHNLQNLVEKIINEFK